jgi:ABC-type phosphate transport system, periplasmic component
MKKTILKRRRAVVLAAVLGLLFTGCASGNEAVNETSKIGDSNSVSKEGEEADLSLGGSVLMVGSTSMDKFANAIAEVYMIENPNVTVTTEFVGSGAGIEAAINKTADIGNSSRNLREEEIVKGAVENIVAIDGIAVVTDKANIVESLTKEQLKAIYTGGIRNWSELGGQNQPIVVIGREAGSGTRSAFEEILGIEDKAVYANELDSTGAVIAKATSISGVIGYVSLDVVNDTVKTLKLDDMEANAENIRAGEYFLSRPFVMATNGEISEQTPQVQSLFTFIFSEEGSEIIRAIGLIPVE